MKNITKTVKVMNCSWTEKDNKGNDEEFKDSVKDVVVKVNDVAETDDVVGWVFEAYGLERPETTDEVKATKEWKSIGGLCRFAETQVRHHEGTTATRAKATSFLKGECTRADLDGFAYTPDYAADPKVKGNGKARAMELLGLTADELEMLEKLRAAKNAEGESEDSQEEQNG